MQWLIFGHIDNNARSTVSNIEIRCDIDRKRFKFRARTCVSESSLGNRHDSEKTSFSVRTRELDTMFRPAAARTVRNIFAARSCSTLRLQTRVCFVRTMSSASTHPSLKIVSTSSAYYRVWRIGSDPWWSFQMLPPLLVLIVKPSPLETCFSAQDASLSILLLVKSSRELKRKPRRL